MTTHSQKFLQQRRFYMVLPLLALPFITLLFWALGGGKGGEVQAQEIKSGFNMDLPGAHFSKETEMWDKLSLYEQARRDSLKREEDKRNDPYYVITTLGGIAATDTVPQVNELNTSLGEKNKYRQIQKDEREINRKVELLTRQLEREEAKPSLALGAAVHPASLPVPSPETNSSAEVERLEKMMELMKDGGGSDSEMQQMNGMLEKILDIQHPDRVMEKLREESRKHQQQVYPVLASPQDDDISTMDNSMVMYTKIHADSIQQHMIMSVNSNGFYGLDEENVAADTQGNAIKAVIHDTQTIVAGSTIQLRLLADVYINGQFIPKDQFVFGVGAISGERLLISITSVRNENALLPVALDVYDLDGLPGIYIPGAISRDVAKQASSQAIQDIQMYSMNNSLEMQAATAGIEAAKGLFTKKAKLIKVTVKAGYQVLLKDKNEPVNQ